MARSKTSPPADALRRRAEDILKERRKLKLEGVVGDLECVVVNVEPGSLDEVTAWLLCATGYDLALSFEDRRGQTCVLALDGSADLLVRCRQADNPFLGLDGPLSRRRPNTRLETYVFGVTDLERFVRTQRRRGVEFLLDETARHDSFLFNQTRPSPRFGASVGFIEWTGRRGEYFSSDAEELAVRAAKPASCSCLASIGRLDHAAVRVRPEDREEAVIELLGLTNHAYDATVHAEAAGALSSAVRFGPDSFAMVFTADAATGGEPGPVGAFVRDHGPRAHHLAFQTESLTDVVEELRQTGLTIPAGVLGSPETGLRQAFTAPHPSAMLAIEYLQRFHDFDGFHAAAPRAQATA